MKRHHIAAILLLFLLLVVYLFFSPAFQLDQFFESLKSTDFLTYGLALVLVTLGNVVYSLRWSAIMVQAGARSSSEFLHAFGTFSLGQAAGMVVPTRAGNYAKVPLVVQRDGIPYGTCVSAVNAETLVDLVYIVFAGIAGVLILAVSLSAHALRTGVLLLLVLTALCLAFVVARRLGLTTRARDRLVALSGPSSPPFVRIPAGILRNAVDLAQSTGRFFSSGYRVTALFALTILAQVLGACGLALVITSVHASVPFLQVFAILMVSVVIGILSMIPGGLGASDLTLIVLLQGAGVPLPDATNIAILWRFAMYIPILAVSGLYLAHQSVNGTGTPP